MELERWGWAAPWQEAFENLGLTEQSEPGRVIRGSRRIFGVRIEGGEVEGRVGPSLRKRGEAPAVGDWIALGSRESEGVREILAILPRRTALSRRGPMGREQVVAANVDVAFILTDAQVDLNLRRLERYLAICWAGRVKPVIVVNKVDRHDRATMEQTLAAVQGVAGEAEVVAVSVVEGVGLDRLRELLVPGSTVALLGSSGVGKSSLVNRLVGREVMATGETRADGKGRHTTTRRQLFLLPGGAMVVDTPGMRALGLWDAAEGVSEAFADIEEVARGCRFRDCTHGQEPGCAVRAAVERGELDEARVRSYRRLVRETEMAREGRPIAGRRAASPAGRRRRGGRAGRRRR